MARSASPRPDDYDCLCFPATPPPRTRGAEKKESAGLRLNQLCPPYVAPSSISFFGRRLSGVHTVGNRFVINRITNRFCQSSASSAASTVRGVGSSGPSACHACDGSYVTGIFLHW